MLHFKPPPPHPHPSRKKKPWLLTAQKYLTAQSVLPGSASSTLKDLLKKRHTAERQYSSGDFPAFYQLSEFLQHPGYCLYLRTTLTLLSRRWKKLQMFLASFFVFHTFKVVTIKCPQIDSNVLLHGPSWSFKQNDASSKHLMQSIFHRHERRTSHLLYRLLCGLINRK